MKIYTTNLRVVTTLIRLLSLALALSGCTGSDPSPLHQPPGTTVPNFASITLAIAENDAAGLTLQFNLSKPAVRDTILRFYSTNYYNGGDTAGMIGSVYSTAPETIIYTGEDWNAVYVPVRVQKGETMIEFTVLPIDNNVPNKYDPILEFKYTGTENFTCTLTIVDDE